MSQDVSLDEVRAAVVDVSSTITAFHAFIQTANGSDLHSLDEKRLEQAIQLLKDCGGKFDTNRLGRLLQSVFQLDVAMQVMERLRKEELVR